MKTPTFAFIPALAMALLAQALPTLAQETAELPLSAAVLDFKEPSPEPTGLGASVAAQGPWWI